MQGSNVCMNQHNKHMTNIWLLNAQYTLPVLIVFTAKQLIYEPYETSLVDVSIFVWYIPLSNTALATCSSETVWTLKTPRIICALSGHLVIP